MLVGRSRGTYGPTQAATRAATQRHYYYGPAAQRRRMQYLPPRQVAAAAAAFAAAAPTAVVHVIEVRSGDRWHPPAKHDQVQQATDGLIFVVLLMVCGQVIRRVFMQDGAELLL